MANTDPKQIPDLQTGSVVSSADYMVIRQGIYDKKFQISQLTSVVTSDALKISKNLSDITNISAARLNLGLASAALKDVGTAAGQIPLLDSTGALPAVSGANLTNLPFPSGGAGAGLSVSNNTFSVNVDQTTIEIANNVLRLKGFTGPILDSFSGLKQSSAGSISVKVDNVTTTINSAGELVAVNGASAGSGSSASGSTGSLLGLYVQTGDAGIAVGARHADGGSVPAANRYTDIYPPSGKLMSDFIGGVVSQSYWQGAGGMDINDEMFAYYENKGSFLRVYHYYTDGYGSQQYLTRVKYVFYWKESLPKPVMNIPGILKFDSGILNWTRTSAGTGSGNKPITQYVTPPAGYTVADLQQFNLEQKYFTFAPSVSGDGIGDNSIHSDWTVDTTNNRIGVYFSYSDESVGDGDSTDPVYEGAASYYWNAVYMKSATGPVITSGVFGTAATSDTSDVNDHYTDLFPPSGKTMANLQGGMTGLGKINTSSTVSTSDGINSNDVIRTDYEILSDRIRVWHLWDQATQSTVGKCDVETTYYFSWS